MKKTNILVNLIKRRACSGENPYPFVAGYLEAFLERLEREVPGNEWFFDREIDRCKKALAPKIEVAFE